MSKNSKPNAQEAEEERHPLISPELAAEGQFINRQDRVRYPIPAVLNLLLVAAQMTAALAILRAASVATNTVTVCFLAVAFAFIMQLGFCLSHEAVHGKLHGQRRVNLGLGILTFSLFPGSYHFFEVAHLIHHRRNRSDGELEDYVLPTETPWLKRLTYYLLISGLFWLLIPLSSIAIAMVPRNSIRLPAPGEDAGAFRRFAQFLNEVRPQRVRRDLFIAGLLWVVAVPLLNLKLSAIVVCYWVFAFSWASQQYVYHVRTPRHVVLGALDLRLWRPLELLYLHFNYHLTHHLAVWVPWIHLPRIAAEHPNQGYFRTYVGLWRPPELVDEAWPSSHQVSGPLPPRPDVESVTGGHQGE
jgi:fatty acid desaturase